MKLCFRVVSGKPTSVALPRSQKPHTKVEFFVSMEDRMSGYISYNGIPCECAHCGAKVSENNADFAILWANQHGTGIRVFCHKCGHWTNWKITAKRGLTSEIYKPIVPHFQFMDCCMTSYRYAYRQLINGWLFREDWRKECVLLRGQMGVSIAKIEAIEQSICKTEHYGWMPLERI
jgi:hypothetical protein